MNRWLTITTTAALIPITAAALWAPSAAANDRTTTLHFTTTNTRNTDIDLGKAGESPGDMQLFVDDILRNGRKVGHNAGACQIALLTKKLLIAHCSATITLDDGSLTVQFQFSEDPAVGPQGSPEVAVTGGTGRYRGVSGEAFSEPIPGTDDAKVTIRLVG